MNQLVSVIIPCYNAQDWIAETIDSCLAQTYPHVEIIVVDDGSTDQTPTLLRAYGDTIRYVRQPRNQGGNAARNRGFDLSKGAYIQWLDADDLIRPEKLAHQVRFLQETDYDIVYGDWQALYNYPDGRTRLSRVMEPGWQTDVLESLLADWWTAVASLLYRRSLLERAPRWNEQHVRSEDRPYMLALAMMGARMGYQPGCYSIYRRYGASITSSAPLRWIETCEHVVDAARAELTTAGRLTAAYRHAIALSYFKLSRQVFRLDAGRHRQLLRKALAVAPDFQSRHEASLYRWVQRTIGFYQTEQLVAVYRRLRRQRWVADEW